MHLTVSYSDSRGIYAINFKAKTQDKPMYYHLQLDTLHLLHIFLTGGLDSRLGGGGRQEWGHVSASSIVK